MNNWRAVGYIFLGLGLIVLMYSILVGLTLWSGFSMAYQQNPNPIVAQTAQTATLVAMSPFFIGAASLLVVAGVGLYAGREAPESKADEIVERIDKLETIVDNNFGFLDKRLDKVEAQQQLVSQSTILKAKRESS